MSATSANIDAVAASLRTSLSLLRRALRETPDVDGLTLPESAALARLDHHGPATATKLAKLEKISPQSIGATVATLEERGLITRAPDPTDGRRVILSLTDAGAQILQQRRAVRDAHLAEILTEHFTGTELEQLQIAAPLLERLGHLA